MPEDCMSTNTLDQEDIRRRVQAYIVDDLIQRGFLPAEKRSPVPVLTGALGQWSSRRDFSDFPLSFSKSN